MNLKLLTFNLLYADASKQADEDKAGTWEQRRGLVEKIIRDHEPDVVGMQEVQDSQLHDLCEYLSEYEPIPGPVNGVDRMPIWTRYAAPVLVAATAVSWWWRKRGKGGIACYATCSISSVLTIVLLAMTAILQQKKGRALKTGGHCPVFVRRNRFEVLDTGTFWVSHQPKKPNSILIGTWLPRIVNWAKLEELETGKRLTVFNTHLDWWMLAHRRSGQILARILNDFNDGSPQVVMGDFNATKESSLYRVLTEQAALTGAPLQDAWQSAGEKIGPEETYHGGNGAGSFPGRVDHILLRPAAKVHRTVTLEEHAGEIYPSDHFPLLTDIEWKEN